ncbi:hypothetical protein SOVF_152140 [Spinacia oleracea]|nr:hypothetical protein SOVF_152140 [Spinacia oleracea]
MSCKIQASTTLADSSKPKQQENTPGDYNIYRPPSKLRNAVSGNSGRGSVDCVRRKVVFRTIK